MMDEISMGLAPIVVDHLFAIVGQLKATGVTMIVVEQYLTHVLRIADICYVMTKGQIAFVGEPGELTSSQALDRAYLGASGGG
jgi:branched-chain amino acid transport system ATP-binding protein